MKQIALILTFVGSQLVAYGQSPNRPPGLPVMPQIPQPATLAPQVTIGFPSQQPQMPGATNLFAPNAQTQRNNELIMQEVEQHEQRRLQQLQLLAEADEDIRRMNQPIQYELPDQSQQEGGELFKQSFAELSDMLEGKQDLSLKRAVYLSEKPYYKDLDYEWFCYLVQREVDFVKTTLAAVTQTTDNNDAVKWMLYRLFSDTIEVGSERHIPFTYDFDDPFGKTDWTKMFVTKLLTTRKGQCHSMPLLYLILAEELGVDAYLAYSPQHSYIKVRNNKGNWFNFETTNGHYTNDSWVLSSNYIKVEAVQNPSTIREYPDAHELLRLRDEIYNQMDALGFEEMPEEAYTRWLQSFEAEKAKQPVEIIRP